MIYFITRCLDASLRRMSRLRSIFASLMLICILAGCAGANGVGPTGTLASPAQWASWSQVVSKAQQEAAKYDKAAVVEWVLADLKDHPIENDKPVQISFVFVRSSGWRMNITLSDTYPPTVVSATSQYDWGAPLSATELQRYINAFSAVKLGPREAYQATLSDAARYTDGPDVNMYLDQNYQSDLGVQVVWSVHYFSYERQQELTLRVDPQTSRIADRESRVNGVLVTPQAP